MHSMLCRLDGHPQGKHWLCFTTVPARCALLKLVICASCVLLRASRGLTSQAVTRSQTGCLIRPSTPPSWANARKTCLAPCMPGMSASAASTWALTPSDASTQLWASAGCGAGPPTPQCEAAWTPRMPGSPPTGTASCRERLSGTVTTTTGRGDPRSLCSVQVMIIAVAARLERLSADIAADGDAANLSDASMSLAGSTDGSSSAGSSDDDASEQETESEPDSDSSDADGCSRLAS